MSDEIDAIETPDENPEEPQAPAAPTPEEQIASYRKRQAGAEAARQAAEKKLADAEKELAGYRTKNQTASEAELSNVATLQERLAAAEKRANEAEAKAHGEVLDAKYPNARKDLPEVTDEVRLAKFEAMLREDEAPEPPKLRSTGAPRSDGVGGEPAKPRSNEDIVADLKARGLGSDDWTTQISGGGKRT